MLNAMKKLNKHNVEDVNPNMLFPLNRWNSFYLPNMKLCRDINRDLFFVNNEILLRKLALLNKGVMPRYVKAKKVNEKALELLESIMYQENHYGKTDMKAIRPFLIKLLQDNKRLEEFCISRGLDNKERKILGLKPVKVEKIKVSKSKGKSLFEF